MNRIRLSVLDQSPIRTGETATQALQETTELAKLTDELGYTRFWVAEHHNGKSFAGSAPEILIAHLANHTKRMRIGSGGVMLPNHSALKMADNFRLLEALFPGRIDMGIGRAPGTDRLTASLLNPSNTFNPQEFVDQLFQLEHFFHNADKKGSIFEHVRSMPYIQTTPQRWLLTSSGESALFAAEMGLPISFAHFINPSRINHVAGEYNNRFVPSEDFKEPMSNVAVFAFCSEDKEKVKRQQAIINHWFVELERVNGRIEFAKYEDIKNEIYTPYEERRLSVNRLRTIMGTPDEVKPRIQGLASSYDTDEVMLVTYSETKEDKQESYRLFAKMFDLH